VTLTTEGRALRAEAENIPHRIVERLGLPMADLENLRSSLHAIISAAVRTP
jgi:hypothetical protein